MLTFSPLWHLCLEQWSVLLPLKWCLQYCLLWLLCGTEQSNSKEKEERNRPQESLNPKLHEHRLAIESKRLEGRQQSHLFYPLYRQEWRRGVLFPISKGEGNV